MITDPLVPLISRLRLTPDIMTTIGLVINLVAAVIIGFGHLVAGALIFLLAGLFDLLDGALARYMEKTSSFGALFDSTVDRVTEGALFLSFIFITGPGGLALRRYAAARAYIPGYDRVVPDQLYQGQGRGA